MAQNDLESLDIDLMSSNSSLHLDKTDIEFNNDPIHSSPEEIIQQRQSSYPCINKLPQPPPISPQNLQMNDGKSKSSLNIFSKMSKSTSKRMSLRGQLRQARISLQKFVNPKIINSDKSIPRWVLKGAKGIVFLTVVKAGFVFAGSVGTGCVIVKNKNGLWSGPSSIGVAGIAAGFLVGASKIDYIMILPNENAVKQFTGKGQLRLGGELQLAVGPFGRDASGSVGTGDKGFSVVYSYSHAAGLYGGLGLDGKIISVRPSCNEHFYGKKLSVCDILLGDLDPLSIENEDYSKIVHLLDAYCDDDDDEKKKNDHNDESVIVKGLFGVRVSDLECSKIKGYESKIPNVLQILKNALFQYEGHFAEGIFQTKAKKSKLKIVKDMIDDGMMNDINFEDVDPHIIAALIKVWYQQLPSMIFEDLKNVIIENAETVSDIEIILDGMNEPNLSLLYWILDLCLDISKYADINRMSVHNMAVAIAPCLYKTAKSSALIKFVRLCIETRMEMKHLNDASDVMEGLFATGSNNEKIQTPRKPNELL